ncbi:MAG: hypothetical protein QE570_09265 [Verrucomicrobiota bacterium]|nr:hypothetical protein [Verrucomicrobiota bacterium]
MPRRAAVNLPAAPEGSLESCECCAGAGPDLSPPVKQGFGGGPSWGRTAPFSPLV